MWRLHNLKRAILLAASTVVQTGSLSRPGRSYATRKSAKFWKSRKREIFSAEKGKGKKFGMKRFIKPKRVGPEQGVSSVQDRSVP
jgi:hypothetical protein